jgi:hypothetical protein
MSPRKGRSDQRVRLATEDFLRPVEKFNDIIGPLFKTVKFPLDRHYQGTLVKALTWCLTACFHDAKAALEKLQPSKAASRAEQINWQNNLQYLRQRYNHFLEMLHVPFMMRNPNYIPQEMRAYKEP